MSLSEGVILTLKDKSGSNHTGTPNNSAGGASSGVVSTGGVSSDGSSGVSSGLSLKKFKCFAKA